MKLNLFHIAILHLAVVYFCVPLIGGINIKGIILAGGTGTRLAPLTKITNKHLLPVGKEPMIFNPIKQLTSVGIRDILIITSKEHMGEIVGILGSGREFNCEFTFKVQEEAGGIAQALSRRSLYRRGFDDCNPG